jgi:hypothetical protein
MERRNSGIMGNGKESSGIHQSLALWFGDFKENIGSGLAIRQFIRTENKE